MPREPTGVRFGPPHHPTIHDSRALYHMGGQMFAPLHSIGFACYRGVQAPQTTDGIKSLIRRVWA